MISTIGLRSFEGAYHHEIELSDVEIELYSRGDDQSLFPSSIPFAIPLLPDTPQSIQTPHSFLGHTLTATLHPVNPHLPPLSKNLTVHTRRYSSHNQSLPSSPEAMSLEDPTRVDVELPRNTFTSGEAIPLYVTVPPPSRETVVDQGLRLRNVRAELVRVVKVKREYYDDNADSDSDIAVDDNEYLQGSSDLLNPPDSHPETSNVPSSSKMPLSPLFLGSSYRVVIARSGASCRFHSSRPIQLRFVLHPSSVPSPSDSRTEVGRMDSDIESPLITQSTLLHSVSFHIKIHVSFVNTTSQTERISTMVIPITILPTPAPLPEVSPALDDAYQKKHDQPPTRTVREEEVDPSIPHYSEAGPSMLPSGAPPPFEERDAPPPFFVSALEASSSSRLPTFQESEREIFLPDSNDLMDDILVPREIPGEGTIFGFSPQEQFDGHSEDMQRASTPPPPLEMASRDTDLTSLTEQATHAAIEALTVVLDQREGNSQGGEQPPPPPAMDDPSDPPPSIDSHFRSPVPTQQTTPSRSSPPLLVPYHQGESPPPLRVQTSTPATALPPQQPESSHGHAPPPYLIPGSQRESENDQVMRPPPYVD